MFEPKVIHLCLAFRQLLAQTQLAVLTPSKADIDNDYFFIVSETTLVEYRKERLCVLTGKNDTQ